MSDLHPSLADRLKALLEDLEKMRFTDPIPTLQVKDVQEEFKHLLTPEAVAGLEPAKKTTLYAFDAEKGPDAYSRSIYLSAIAHTPEGIEKAAKLVCDDLNKLAAAGVLRGNLARLSILTLADLRFVDLHEYIYPEGAPKSYAIFCFPHVSLEWKPEGLSSEAQEGAIGNDVEPEKVVKPKHAPDCGICKMLDESGERMKAALRADETIPPEEREQACLMLDCKPENPCMLARCPKCKGGPESAG